MPDRAPVDFAMDRLRRHIRAFETAWAALPVSQQRVLVLRCDGRSLQEVAQHLGMTPQTANQYSKRVMVTMRDAIGEGDVSALCWLYGYSRALLDIDEQVMNKQRSINSTSPLGNGPPQRWRQDGNQTS